VSGAFYGLNGQLDLDTVSFGIASLSDTYADGVTAGGASLTTALSNASYPLDPEVSLFLAAFSVPSYADQDIVHYVSSYTAIVNYAAGADDLAYAAYYLSETGQVGETTADGWLAALAADPTVDLGAKLDIESIRYGWGTVE